MTKETKQAFDDRFTREMTETAEGMCNVGVMDDPTYKLTMRDLNRTRAGGNGLSPDGLRDQGAARRREIEPGCFRALPPSDC